MPSGEAVGGATLKYAGEKAFYRSLLSMLEAGSAVSVVTPFRSYDELPRALKTLFALAEHRSADWVDPVSSKFIARATAPASVHVATLHTRRAAERGLTIGLFGFGLIGAGLGAAIGRMTGALRARRSDFDPTACILISAEGAFGVRVALT